MTERIPVIYNQSANQLQEVTLTDEVSVGIFTARMISNPNIITNEVVSIANSNHNYANRNIIHFSQAKQAIGIYLSSYKDRMDISQILYNPQIPLVTTQAMKYNGFLDLPYGENAIVAICSYNGYNQEDSIIFNQSAIERGMFSADTLKKYNSEITKNPSTSQDDIFTKPDRNKVTGMKQGYYDKLNETELPSHDKFLVK